MAITKTQRMKKMSAKADAVLFLHNNNIDYEEFNMGNHFIIYHPEPRYDASKPSAISFWPTTGKWALHGVPNDKYNTSSFEDLKRYLKDMGYY